VHPRKFVRDSLGFTLAQYALRVLLMLRGIVAARLLGPMSYGAWNALQLIMDYGAFSTLGTQQGLDQAVPARIVEANAANLERLKRAGLFNIVLMSVLFAGGSLLFLVARDSKILGFWGVGGAALALTCVVLTNISNFHTTLLRSHGDIGAVSLWFLIQGAIGAILGLALIPSMGVWGLLTGWVVGTAASTLFVRIIGRKVVPLMPRPSFDGLALVRVGFPMFVFMGSALVMRSIDRVIILKFLGTTALGYYSLAVMALTFMLYLPDSIAFVLYPRLLLDFRRGDNHPEVIRPRVERSLRALAVVMPGLCGIAFLVAREAVMAVLPRFVLGVTATRVLCFGAAALSLGNLSSIVLMTLGRQNVLVPAALAMTAIGAGLDILAVRAGFDISGVARATLVTYTVNGTLLLWLACRGLRIEGRHRARLIGSALVPLVTGGVLAYAIDRVLPWGDSAPTLVLFSRLMVAVALFAGIYGALMLPLVRGLGLKQVARELQLPFPFFGSRAEAPRT